MARKSDVPMSEPAKRTKRKRIWEDNDEATPPPSAQRVKIKDRLSINQLINDKGGSENGTYTKESTPSGTPSGKTKRNNRGKHLPPGFRPGHVSSTNDKRTGLFSPEEIETLEQYKLWFCNYHHITADTFDASIQSAKSSKNGIFLQDRPPVDEKSFWQEIYGQIPDRDRRSIARFCRRHFSNAYKPHQWTTADDDELERLHSMYGTKWAIIARDMERTYDDVVQRWKNKVEHRHTMKMGPWDDDEVDKLIKNLEDTRKAWLRLGKTKEDIGKDIYELPDEFIAWGKISERFEHTRSRQQVADKWRKIKRIVLERRADGFEDAVWEPSLQPKGRRKSKSRQVSVESEKRVFTSNEMVHSSDEDEDQNKKKTEKKKQPAKANGTAQPEANESADESTDESSDSSSEDDSDDSSSDEKSKAAKKSDKDGEDDDDDDDVVNESTGEETPLPKTNGYHAAEENESVIPESQVEESQAEESEASPSRSSSPEAETNGHRAAEGRQPSEELGLDPVSAPKKPEAEKDTQASENEDDDDDDDDDDEGSDNAGQEVAKPLSSSSQTKPKLEPASSPAKPIKSHLIKKEEKHPSRPHDSGSESESDDDESRGKSSSGSGSDDDDDDDENEEEEEELSPEEIEKKIFKFKQEPDD